MFVEKGRGREQSAGLGFVIDQPALAVDAEAVVADVAAGAHDAVARDDETDRVGRIGRADGACCAGCAIVLWRVGSPERDRSCCWANAFSRP